MFLNRVDELRQLDTLDKAPQAQLVVLYGRRRIGKTALVQHWISLRTPTTASHWIAHRTTSARLLAGFSEAISPLIGRITQRLTFDSWESALRQLFELAEHRRLYFAIDELPYLMEAEPEITSLLQRLWDQRSPTCQLFLILSGSHYQMMHAEFLAGRAPLYGRATAPMKLEEVPLQALEAFLPSYSPSQRVETYAVVGGVPKYLEMWDDQRPVLTNIATLLLSPTTLFRDEALFLIQDELSEPRTYLAILEALGCGFKRPKQLADDTGLLGNHVGRYLSTLVDLDLVRREVSIDAADPHHSRLSRYEIRDPYLRFYFQFVSRRSSWLEQGRIERLMHEIEAWFPSFVARSGFEELCRRRIIQLGDNGSLPFVPDEVGHLWNARAEVDVAAIQRRDKQVLIGEAKWESEPMGVSHLDGLLAKVKHFPEVQEFHVVAALFSKSGFTRALVARAKAERVWLFEGAELNLL